jgi:hypothetical protein
MQQKSKQQTIQLESDKELQSSIEDDVDIPAIAQNTENKVANTNILENTNDANTQTVQALPDLSALPKLQIEKLVNSAPNQIQTNQYNHKETESTKQLTHYKLDMQ